MEKKMKNEMAVKRSNVFRKHFFGKTTTTIRLTNDLLIGPVCLFSKKSVFLRHRYSFTCIGVLPFFWKFRDKKVSIV